MSQLDVFATILTQAGVDNPPSYSVDLDPSFSSSGEEAESRQLVSEIKWSGSPSGAKAVALRVGDMKYIARFTVLPGDEFAIDSMMREEVYDLSTDRLERRDLSGAEARLVEMFRGRLESYLNAARNFRKDRAAREIILDEQKLKELETLGYVH